MNKQKIDNYDSKSIGDLPFPLNVQKRIGMYLGSKGEKGKFHTSEEIIANSIDEFGANPDTNEGYGKVIDFKLLPYIHKGKEYESLLIKDRGRGIPIDIHEKSGKPALTYILTNLHVGGKIDNNASQTSYVASGGLNGIGASAVMAVSRYFEVTVIRDGRVVRQSFEFGYATGEMRDIKPKEYDPTTEAEEFLIIENFDNSINIKELQEQNPNKYVIERGTEILYITWDREDEEDIIGLFDPDILWDKNQLKERLHEHCYLNNGLIINFITETEIETFQEKDGVLQYLKDRSFQEETKDQVILEPIRFNGYIDNKQPKFITVDNESIKNPKYKFIILDLAFGFGVFSDSNVTKKHFVNNLPMPSGGKQDHGMKAGFIKVLNEIAEKEKIIKDFEKNKLNSEDVSNALNFILSIKIENPDFEGQTKNKLSNSEAQTLTREFLSGNKYIDGYFKEWCDENKEIAKNLIKTLDTVRKEKRKSEASYEKLLQDKLSSEARLGIAHKLKDCRSKDNTLNELFICEGDSAKGPITNSRNANFQAILPMKGKVLKAWEEDNIKKLAENTEIGSIITALGCGWYKTIEVEKCKYSKIIILSDADDDGYHITTLLETLFYRYFPDLVKAGRLYVALSPLFEIWKGKEKKYLYNIEELRDFALERATELNPNEDIHKIGKIVKEELSKNQTTIFGWGMKRNKGLGEMNPEDMWNSTLNPHTRRMVQLNYIGTDEEIEKINMYMSGETNYIEQRRDKLSNQKFEA